MDTLLQNIYDIGWMRVAIAVMKLSAATFLFAAACFLCGAAGYSSGRGRTGLFMGRVGKAACVVASVVFLAGASVVAHAVIVGGP